MKRIAVVLAAVALAGCADESTAPTAPETPPLGSLPTAPRVIVINTLSETISALDLDTGTMNVQAALAGAWTNRATASPDARLLLVTDSGDNDVRVLDAGSLATLARIDVGLGKNPFLARALGDGTALVSNWLTAEVQLLDLAGERPAATIATTPGPEGFVVVGDRAFVACTNYQGAAGTYGEGRVEVIDLAERRLVTSLAVSRNPRDVVIGADGRIHVVCAGDYGAAPGRVDVLDAGATSVVGSVDLGGSPARAALGPDGAMWVVGFYGACRRYDPTALTVREEPIDPTLPSTGLSAIAFDATAGRAYVTAFSDDLLLAIDVASRLVVDLWLVGDGPVDVLVQRP